MKNVGIGYIPLQVRYIMTHKYLVLCVLVLIPLTVHACMPYLFVSRWLRSNTLYATEITVNQ